MEEMRLIACLVFLVGCLPTGGPPEGTLRGTVGGSALDVTIDESSKLILDARKTCADSDTNRFSLNYGDAAFHIEFDVTGVSVLGDVDVVVPTTDSRLHWFRVDEPPAMVSATLSVGIHSALGRRSGDFRVTYMDGSMVEGDFDLFYDSRGDRPNCGGGGGGDDD